MFLIPRGGSHLNQPFEKQMFSAPWHIRRWRLKLLEIKLRFQEGLLNPFSRLPGRRGACADSTVELFGDYFPASALCAQRGNPRGVHESFGPSELLSLGACVSHSRFHSLDDQTPLQLGDGAQDRKNHLAGGRGSTCGS